MKKSENIMIFEINNQLFGYPSKYIKENVTVEKIFKVPNSPEYIKGIFNLRNNAIPLIDTGFLLFKKKIESSLVIVIEKGEKKAGILIDKLKGVVKIDSDLIEKNMEVEGFNKEFLNGVFEYQGNSTFLLRFDNIFNLDDNEKTIKLKHREKKRKKASKISKKLYGLIVFKIKEEWFALNVKNVKEILTFPEKISPVPDSKDWLTGLFLLRKKNIMLVDLPKLLNFPDEKPREKVILVSVDNLEIGFAVPYVKEIKWIDKKEIIEVKNNRINNKGIIPLENGKRLVLLLDVEKFFLNVKVDKIEKIDDSILEKGENMTKYVKYLHFKVDNINMGINIKKVQEVVELHNINRLPKSPKHILGMINLRNSVITVISLSKKLGIKKEIEDFEEQRLIVIDGSPVAILVDKLEGILSFSEDEIFPPEENSEIDNEYLEGITKLKDNELLFILNIENIFNKDEEYISD